MSERIISILMKRDKMGRTDAQDLVNEGRETLLQYIDDGDMDAAESVCEEYFGLEPDYLDDLM